MLPYRRISARCQSGNQAQDLGLVSPPQPRLEADQIEHRRPAVRTPVLLSKLHHGKGPLPRPWIPQTHRAHRAEAECVLPSLRQLLDRQTSLEVFGPLELVERIALSAEQRLPEPLVLLPCERAVEIVGPPHLIAGGGKGNPAVDRIGGHDGGDGVVEVEQPTGGRSDGRWLQERREALFQVRREPLGGKRTRRHDDRARLRKRGHLFPDQFDLGVSLDRPGNRGGERFAVHRQSRACRDPVRLGGGKDQRPKRPHFSFEETAGILERFGFQGVAADQLGESVGLVGRRPDRRAHLEETDGDATLRRLPGGLAAGQPAADNRDEMFRHAGV